MLLPAGTLTAVRAASTRFMTSTGQWLVQSVSSTNTDGSNNYAFTATGPTFACNVEPMRGSEVPAPLALKNVSFFKLFVPYTQDPNVTERVTVDGLTYEVHDVQNPRSPDVISIMLTVSVLQ